MNDIGFTETLSYIKSSDQNINNRETKKKRKRKIICYNPTFSLNVKTNVGKIFFKILRKIFSKTNPLSKIFNKNTVNISYSCTRNVESIISCHNKQILHPKLQPYGCGDKNNCPLDNKCLTSQIVYQADVTNDTEDTYKYYLGFVETTFKDRYRNHISSFNNEQNRNNTELSKYLWSLKNDITLIINWKIMKYTFQQSNIRIL